MRGKASGRRKTARWIALFAGLAVAIAVLALVLPRINRENSLAGAVLTANADPRKQSPIRDAEITLEIGGTTLQAKSDASGFFRLKWPARVWQREDVTLRFRHPGYEPLEITQPLSDRLCIARMTHSASVTQVEWRGPEIYVADIRVRYSVRSTTTVNVGSAARILEVVNKGNVRCQGRKPCSPDGKWKAAIGTLSFNAGDGQELRNVRVSCIAGPCPFTKLESEEFTRGGSTIDVSVRAWSDTVTFLIEAEVVHTMLSDEIRQAYPSIFGRDMTFTLPPNGEGPSIEAEVNGLETVFPLGPDLNLSWAACGMQATSNGTKLYTCKLRPGYRFR